MKVGNAQSPVATSLYAPYPPPPPAANIVVAPTPAPYSSSLTRAVAGNIVVASTPAPYSSSLTRAAAASYQDEDEDMANERAHLKRDVNGEEILTRKKRW
jgi:hypothetical protein